MYWRSSPRAINGTKSGKSRSRSHSPNPPSTANARVHAVGGQQHVALRLAAVVEVRDDRVAPVFDRDQALAIAIGTPRRVVSSSRICWNAARRMVTPDPDRLGLIRPMAAPLVAEGELARWRARRRDLIARPRAFRTRMPLGAIWNPPPMVAGSG